MLCSQMGLFERSFNCIQFSCCLVLRNSSQGLMNQSLLNLQCEKLLLLYTTAFKNVCFYLVLKNFLLLWQNLKWQKETIYKCEKGLPEQVLMCKLFQYQMINFFTFAIKILFSNSRFAIIEKWLLHYSFYKNK